MRRCHQVNLERDAFGTVFEKAFYRPNEGLVTLAGVVQESEQSERANTFGLLGSRDVEDPSARDPIYVGRFAIPEVLR
jgi:hypothetical protein